MQYLVSVIDEVSVIDDHAGLANPEEESAPVRPPASVDAFNARLEAEGHRVFAGVLGKPSTATVIDNRGEQAVLTRRALRGVEGVPRRRDQARRRGVERLQPQGRGAAVPVSPTDVSEADQRPLQRPLFACKRARS